MRWRRGQEVMGAGRGCDGRQDEMRREARWDATGCEMGCDGMRDGMRRDAMGSETGCNGRQSGMRWAWGRDTMGGGMQREARRDVVEVMGCNGGGDRM